MSLAVGHPSRIRTTSRLAVEMMRAGACQNVHRSRLGFALASGPTRQRSWNQVARSEAHMTVWSHAWFASHAVNGNRSNPESFNLWMWSSTWAWARIWRSSSTALPAWSV